MIEHIAAALAVAVSVSFAPEGEITIITDSFDTAPCCTTESGCLTVYGEEEQEGFYKLSLDGGVNYIPVGSLPYSFSMLPEGTYQLRLMKDDGEPGAVRAACLGESGIDEGDEIFLSVTGHAEKEYFGGSVTVTIENYDEDNKYLISFDSGRSWQEVRSRTTELRGLQTGKYSVRVRCENEHRLRSRLVEITVPVKKPAGFASVTAPLTLQLPQLPTGCEVTTLSMALAFWGIRISKTDLSDHFLDKGVYRASDYRKVFVGDPRQKNAYGCYADVIVNCAEKMLDTVNSRSFEVNNISGCSAERLYSYVDMGYPVIVWATRSMLPTEEGPEWTDAETGKKIKWTGNEHCMLLTGYDMNRRLVKVNDPLYGMAFYDMTEFEKRFADLEKQAILIVETTPAEKSGE